MEQFLVSKLRNSRLHFRKFNTCLNNIRYLRKSNFSHNSNLLKMNILSQRSKQTIFLSFANVPIKNEKMNICETFLRMFIFSTLFKWLKINECLKNKFSQINILTFYTTETFSNARFCLG